MVWTYWNWVICNVLVGVGIFLCTYATLIILLCWFHQLFYGMIAKVLNIKRYTVDINNKVVQKNTNIFTSNIGKTNIGRLALQIGRKIAESVEKNQNSSKNVANSKNTDDPSRTSPTINVISEVKKDIEGKTIRNGTEASTNDEQTYGRTSPNFKQISGLKNRHWSNKVGVDHRTESDLPPISKNSSTTETEDPNKDHHPSNSKYIREVLDVYGKYLTLNKKRNKFLIMTIAAIIISSVIITGFQGCVLANITVYQDGSCPFYGVMECFYGPNATYFQCTSNATIDIAFGTTATCFRWIVRDTSVSDVMTQIGSCTGLLVAFGACIEVLIRFLFFVFQQRPGVSAGMRRMLEKTAGINKITRPTHCCGFTIPCHFGLLNIELYQHPWLVLLIFLIYASLPFLGIGSIVLLSYFRISITALTYIVLITVILICLIGLIWVVWEEDEVGKILPGSWSTFSDMVNMMKQSKSLKPLLHGVIPEEDLEHLTNYADGFVHTLKQKVDEMSGKLNMDIKKMITDIPEHFGKKLLTEANQVLHPALDMIIKFSREIGEKLSKEAEQLINSVKDMIEKLPTKITSELSAKTEKFISPTQDIMKGLPKQIQNKLSIETKQLIRPTQDIIKKLSIQIGNEHLTNEAEQLIHSIQEKIESIPTQIVSEIENCIRPAQKVIENLPTQIGNELSTEVKQLLSSVQNRIKNLPIFNDSKNLINEIERVVDPAKKIMDKLPTELKSEHLINDVKELIKSGQTLITNFPTHIDNILSIEVKKLILPIQEMIEELPGQIENTISIKIQRHIDDIQNMIEELPEQIANTILTEIQRHIVDIQNMIEKFSGQIASEYLTSDVQQCICAVKVTIEELSIQIEKNVSIKVEQLMSLAQNKIVVLLTQTASAYLTSEFKQLIRPTQHIIEDFPKQIQKKLLIEATQLIHNLPQNIITGIPTQFIIEHVSSNIGQIAHIYADTTSQLSKSFQSEHSTSSDQQSKRSTTDISRNIPNLNLSREAQDIRLRKLAEQEKDVGNIHYRKN